MTKGSRIFISYRRSEPDAAERIYNYLVNSLGRAAVFMDNKGIRPGDDYRERILRELGTCDAMVVVIGQTWMGDATDQDPSRLHKPDDFVCLEVATALQRDLLVIPVLVNGARMPQRDALPEQLRRLRDREYQEVLPGKHFDDGVAHVLAAIRKRGGASPLLRYRKPVLIGAALVLSVGAALMVAMKERVPIAEMRSNARIDSIPPAPTGQERPDTNKGSNIGPQVSQRAQPAARTTVERSTTSLACDLNGMQFISAPFNRDKLTFTGLGNGDRFLITGQLNGRSINGQLTANGNSLVVRQSSGSDLIGGALTLDEDCRYLRGGVQLRSIGSAGQVNVNVDLFDKARGR